LIGDCRVIGPPGTGKTSFLTKQIARDADVHGASSVLVCSFTRAAAAEIAGRDLPIPDENVGTLHAFAYRAIGHSEIAETRKRLKEFSEAHPHYAIGAAKSAADLEDLGGDFDGQAPGDELLAEYSRLRNLMLDRAAWPLHVVRFADAWEAFKRETDTIDFTDMLEVAYHDADCAPGNPAVLIVDEAQDLSRLQLSLVWRWAKAAEKVVFGADPDQSIYTWAGVSPEVWVEVKPKHLKVLAQSYRVPRAVHALARGWIQRLTDREDFEYHPRLEADGSVAEGLVRQEPYQWTEPELLVEDAARQVAEGRSVMVMAACGYMLEPLVRALRAAAVPFSNPWRRKRSDWNPLYRAGEGTTMDAMKAFLAPHLPDAQEAFWTPRQLAAWAKLTRGAFKRGTKMKLTALEDWTPQAEIVLRVAESMSDEDFAGATAPFPDCLRWLHAKLAEVRKRPAEYALRVAEAADRPDALDEEPKLWVGTIHSFKGGEASCCYVFPDTSRKGFDGFLRDPGPTVRQFYVAFTRAREELVLCDGATPLRVAWPKTEE